MQDSDPNAEAKAAVKWVTHAARVGFVVVCVLVFLMMRPWIWAPTVDAYFPYSGSIFYKGRVGSYDSYRNFYAHAYYITLLTPEGKTIKKYVSLVDWNHLSEDDQVEKDRGFGRPPRVVGKLPPGQAYREYLDRKTHPEHFVHSDSDNASGSAATP